MVLGDLADTLPDGVPMPAVDVPMFVVVVRPSAVEAAIAIAHFTGTSAPFVAQTGQFTRIALPMAVAVSCGEKI